MKVNNHRIWLDYFLLFNNCLCYQVFQIFLFILSVCPFDCFSKQKEVLSPHSNVSLSRKIYWCIILREFTLKIFMKINTLILFLIHTWYTSSTQSCILKENFQKPSFLLFSYFLLRWINSNKFKFELVHLHKNIKTKENCFKKF